MSVYGFPNKNIYYISQFDLKGQYSFELMYWVYQIIVFMIVPVLYWQK